MLFVSYLWHGMSAQSLDGLLYQLVDMLRLLFAYTASMSRYESLEGIVELETLSFANLDIDSVAFYNSYLATIQT
jgi:hypothetical protein